MPQYECGNSRSPRSSTSSDRSTSSRQSRFSRSDDHESSALSPARLISNPSHREHVFDLETVNNQGLNYSLLYIRGSIAYRFLPLTGDRDSESWKITNVITHSDVGTITKRLNKPKTHLSLLNDEIHEFDLTPRKKFASTAGNGGHKGMLEWRQRRSTDDTKEDAHIECVDHKHHHHLKREEHRVWASVKLYKEDKFTRGKITVSRCGSSQAALDEFIVTAWAMITQFRSESR